MKDRLVFEPSWEKAISDEDRKTITRLHEQNPIQKGVLQFTPIRAAMNHHGALLAMVLIQNGWDEPFTVDGIPFTYTEEGRGVIAECQFRIAQVHVPAGASMPWTFVFPKETIRRRPLLKDWTLKHE
ncbi:SLAP domain-containing protein [Pseudalkalibacillus sp. SCS-8]|uniref:SLAP domain-containing protein n=1 Tax=Pseudalkalibacillus nanhaiensis TaxID=3115291 RepID=UPI0032DB036F